MAGSNLIQARRWQSCLAWTAGKPAGKYFPVAGQPLNACRGNDKLVVRIPGGNHTHHGQPILTHDITTHRERGESWYSRVMITVWRLLDLILHPRRHLDVHRALAPTKLAKIYRRTPFKYLGTYLARSLSVAERAAILTNHYSYLNRSIAEPCLSRVFFDSLPVWQTSRESQTFAIHLSFSHPNDREGELSLIFKADSTSMFTLSFTICPGGVLGVAADHAFLVSRLQGRKRCFEQIREISKLLGDISPAAMLISALTGMAQALDIKDMVSIGANQQVADKPSRATLYDDFWTGLGAQPLNGNYFHVELPLPEKPLNQIKQNHRARTVVKRTFKKQITDHVREEFGKHVERRG